MAINDTHERPSTGGMAPIAHGSATGRADRRDLFGEIDQQIAQLRAEATVRGSTVLPPLLALGLSERVGSNWFTDTLRPVCPQHNEPLRQQIAADHPLSALNPYLHAEESTLGEEVLGPLGTHWLFTFVVSKYATPRHVVKETNLFFAAPVLLRLFADAPVVVLSRSPLGIASSFRRSGLFGRWRYRDRYAQMLTMTRAKPWQRWQALVPDDAPADLVALVRLVVLNTLLLAESLTGRTTMHLPYEAAVGDQHTALAAVYRAVPDLRRRPTTAAPAARTLPPADDTFATNTSKSRLVAFLSQGEADLVRAETIRCLTAADDLASAAVVGRATAWLSGEHHYTLALRPAPIASPLRRLPPDKAVRPRFVAASGLRWRNLLVSNHEYCQFLNALASEGVANTIGGTHLLLTEMPPERGGRIHRDPATGRYRVAEAYDDHPAYWVTWIGAAAFAAHAAARLPSRAQARTLTPQVVDAGANTDYRVGDTTAVAENHLAASEIHHRVGNLQIWCLDGPPDQLRHAGLSRNLHGAAWNTPGAPDEIDRPRSRHLLGSSRGVGIRLVRPVRADPAPVPSGHLARYLRTWISALHGRHPSLTDLDQLVVDALTRSQPDAGLRPHVATGAWEPLHG